MINLVSDIIGVLGEHYFDKEMYFLLQLDIFLNESEFSYEPAQQPLQQDTSLSEQQTTMANDAYLIDEMKQKMMGESAETSLNDLFVVNDDSKFMTEVPATRTCSRGGDQFFSSGVSNERVVPRRKPRRQNSDQSFQQPSAQAAQLNTLLAENRPTMLVENQRGFVQSTSAGQQVFNAGNTHNSLYQVLPHGSQVTVMQDKPGPSSSQLPFWHSPSPSSSSSTRYSPSSELTRPASQQQQQPPANYAILCLQNDVLHPNNCRRGSTGSLQPGKSKKHVTFLCPQVSSIWLSSSLHLEGGSWGVVAQR